MRRRLPALPKLRVVPTRIVTGSEDIIREAFLTTLKMHLWIFNREYRVTYRDSGISSERLVEGKIAERVQPGGPIPISLENRYAKNNGIKVGDTLLWNVQGALIGTVPLTGK